MKILRNRRISVGYVRIIRRVQGFEKKIEFVGFSSIFPKTSNENPRDLEFRVVEFDYLRSRTLEYKQIWLFPKL